MPRKPKVEKHTVTLVINNKPVPVIMHPPAGKRASWYAYWNGLTTSRTTGQRQFDDAIKAVQGMLHNAGERPRLADAILSDEEFEAIQRAHFGRVKDPDKQKRAAKTLKDCLEAIAAFRAISGISPVTQATPSDCAAFQRKALTLPKNWRQKHRPEGKEVDRVRADTVAKWSRELHAAFERANRNAGRKKCVRGVVDDAKLLHENPWRQFTWSAEPIEKPIRQFDAEELLDFLAYLETKWRGVAVGTTLAKVLLWSGCRREEAAGLSWSDYRQVGDEHHFEVRGKRGIDRWFRVPEAVYRELVALRSDSRFAFARYNDQLRAYYLSSRFPWEADRVNAEFRPENLGQWIYKRLTEWSEGLPNGRAYTHVFRKTTMQHSYEGEQVEKEVAKNLRVGAGVMMRHYVKRTDEQRRRESNRTYDNIVASLPPEVARRYGLKAPAPDGLQEKLRAAVAAKDWPLVSRLSAELTQRAQAAAG